MPEKINSNYSASFQQFVDFADKAYAAHKEDTFARFKGMTQEDYQGSFASFLRPSSSRRSRTCSAARSSFPTSCATT